ncbi:MAG: hypothetical protein QGG82_02490, partial [Patescibacteria group bacterium]|nr:hypothetical protein [Patescibacteria group bacterium]
MYIFTNNCDVKLPSGNPLHGCVSKLSIILLNSQRILLSGMYFVRIFFKISWSMFAKNFLMSHFK